MTYCSWLVFLENKLFKLLKSRARHLLLLHPQVMQPETIILCLSWIMRMWSDYKRYVLYSFLLQNSINLVKRLRLGSVRNKLVSKRDLPFELHPALTPLNQFPLFLCQNVHFDVVICTSNLNFETIPQNRNHNPVFKK